MTAFPHPDGLAAAKAAATPGLCAFCEEPLSDARRKQRALTCEAPGCREAYRRAWHRDNQVKHPERYNSSSAHYRRHEEWKRREQEAARG